MASPTRAFLRLAIYLTFTLCCVPIQVLALAICRPVAIAFPRVYHRLCCFVLGLKVVRHGEISAKPPFLLVSNHVSYIDIIVLGSIVRGSFVAKAEVAKWPFFGMLAKLQRTVFIARRGSQALRHRDDVGDRLHGGHNLVLFPEGTSGDGTHVLPFKSALFSAADQEIDGRPLTVQPVSIAYTKLDGMPLGRGLRSYYAWYGDMALLPHLLTWVGMGVVTVEVIFHPPTSFAAFGSRKALAQDCHDTVAHGVAAVLSGAPENLLLAKSERT